MSEKIAIVGGGPTGMMCAAELEKLGEEVIVFERQKRVGEKVECSGLFNINGIQRLGLKRGDYVLNEVKGARFISSSGAAADIRGSENKAYVVDRGEFDRYVAGRFGGEVRLGTRVKSISKKDGGYVLQSNGSDVKVSTVVLATGYDMSLHKSLGFSPITRFFSTSQYEIEGMNIDRDFVELYFGSVSPGFFAWVIPITGERARVGLGVIDAKESTHHYMEAFLKKLKGEGRFKKKNKVIHKSGGLIPVFDPPMKINDGGAYLLGDAAGQVKATTGGGVMIGGLAAKELANAIHNGSDYESNLFEIKKELSNHLLIRNVLNRFGDEQYGHMVEFLNKPSIKSLVEEHSDMDFIGPLMEGVVKNPLLALQAMRLFGKF